MPRSPELLDHDDRMLVARRCAAWYLGSPSWADKLIGAYLDPAATAELLRREMGDDDTDWSVRGA